MFPTAPPHWSTLPPRTRELLRDRLDDLYGWTGDTHANFERLAPDKRHALALLAASLDEAHLWRHIRRVTNVYGRGGTGAAFDADAALAANLAADKNFTRIFARHEGARRGYFQLRRPGCALHLLHLGNASWSAHYDLHSPVASPLSLCRHLWHERIRGVRPSCGMVAARLVGRA